jgi:hypothetical protein
MSSTLDIILTVFFAVFVVLDIFLNVVLVLAIHRKKSLQTPMNLLILHLGITDVLVGVFIIPRHILSYAITYPHSKISDYICQFVTGGNFIWTSVTASSGFLTIIAFERLFAVVYPHQANLRVTKKRLKWLVWACWLSSLAFNLPSLLVLKYDHKNHFCMEDWPSWTNPKAYVGFAFFAGNSSVIAMCVLYSAILFSLWKRHKAVSEVSRAAIINARKRVTRMLILMTVVHAFCRTPNYTFYTLSYFNPGAKYGSTVYSFTVFLILLNSASHPFFFCWYMNNLRRQVFAILPPFFSGHCPARLRRFTLAQSTHMESTESAAHQGAHRVRELLAHSSAFASDSYDERKGNSLRARRYTAQSKVNNQKDMPNEHGYGPGVSMQMDKTDEPQTDEDLIIRNEENSQEKIMDKDNQSTSVDTSNDINSDEVNQGDKIQENDFALDAEKDSDVIPGEDPGTTIAEDMTIFSMKPVLV